MGFYYGSSTPPPDKNKEGSFKETFQIIWAVFSVMVIPMALIFGVLGYLVLLFFLFAWTPLAGLAAILLLVGALAGRGVWEAKHPPELK